MPLSKTSNDQSARDDFVAWARGRAIHFDASATDLDPALLAPLETMLAGKRFAYIGEPDHFIHEKYA
jgi:hypothetical protein